MEVIEPKDIGKELIQRGWRQGSLLHAPSAIKPWLSLNDGQVITQSFWSLQQEPLDKGDVLIVVSQTCDIQKSVAQEPYIEVIRGYWTFDRNIMHQARKNSARLFFIRNRFNDDGQEEALIADATTRIQLEKAALLTLTPRDSFPANNRVASRKFSEWLARRYDRPALSNAIVDALQKPIVKAIEKLSATSDLHPILDGIGQILFFPRNDDPPFQIDMIFLREERYDVVPVNDEGAASLAGWITEILRKEDRAELAHYEVLSLEEISVHDYIHALDLPLDSYTTWDEDTEG